jgi:hypothetical protein
LSVIEKEHDLLLILTNPSCLEEELEVIMKLLAEVSTGDFDLEGLFVHTLKIEIKHHQKANKRIKGESSTFKGN